MSFLSDKHKRLVRFVREYHGPRLALVATGGAARLAELATIPGASRILSSLWVPYSNEQQRQVVEGLLAWKNERLSKQAVSQHRVRQLAEAYKRLLPLEENGQPPRLLVVSACLVSDDRFRKGAGRAWTYLDGKTRLLELETPDEECWKDWKNRDPDYLVALRRQEDWELTDRCLTLLQAPS